MLDQLRVRTGHDFASYKRATVLRRLDRRLHVTGAASLADYLDVLRGNAAEAEALLEDLLISVTNFFRDRDAFDAFEHTVPRLFEGKGPDDEVRVWVAGCATGEEAYSVAMLLLEHAATLPHPPRVQVFATDLSSLAVQTARTGAYPESIEADVPPERLRRFFSHVSGRYRVVDVLRDAVLFTPHSLLADPPFSRLDAVTCRNLLIYFQRDLQQKALALFHYALRSGGLLFLGTSESADVEPSLFMTVDKRARLYRRVDVATPLPALPHVPRVLAAPPAGEARVVADRPMPLERDAGDVEQVHRALRAQTAPPSVLVSEAGDVIDVADGAAAFLSVPTGAPTRQLTRLLRPELRAPVQSALFQARRDGSATALVGPVDVDLSGETRAVAVRARPDATGALVQIVFDVLPLAAVPRGAGSSVAEAEALRLAEDVVRQTQEQLQVAAEEFETSREELRAQNEELQSLNEELRSTAEELETSKEEAQSMAEELRTVNDELKVRVEESARASSDLENLVASTEIATLFLDRALRIQRFTPPVRELFHVRASDVGRPIADLAPRFGEAHLVEDAEAVMARLTPVEREVRTADGRWYLVHVRPYRASEDRIGGVVVTFVDITRRKADEDALRASAEQATFRAALADALRTLSDPVAVQAEAARALGQHLGASRVHYGEVEGGDVVVAQDYTDGVAPLRGHFEMAGFGRTILKTLRAGEPVVVPDVAADESLAPAAREAYARVGVAAQVGVPLVKAGRLQAVLSVHQNTPRAWTAAEVALIAETAERTWAAVEQARAEAELRATQALFDATLSTITDFAYTFDHAGRFLFVNQPLLDLWGLALEDAVGKTFHELDYPPALADRHQREIEEVFETGEGLTAESVYAGIDGEERNYEYIFRPLVADDGTVRLVVGSTRDVTERRRAEAAAQAEARRATFRATLADALRSLSDPADVQAEAARVLGEHLAANRVHYAEVEADGTHAVVARDYARGVPDGSARYDLADFPALLAEARADRTLVVPDIAADDRLSPDEKERFAALPVAAIVVVPLVKNGHLVAVFAVHRSAPYAWAAAEVALVEETAERTWAAVERARAEAALNASEAQMRQVAATVPDVLFRTTPDGTVDFVNEQFEALTGYAARQRPRHEDVAGHRPPRRPRPRRGGVGRGARARRALRGPVPPPHHDRHVLGDRARPLLPRRGGRGDGVVRDHHRRRRADARRGRGARPRRDARAPRRGAHARGPPAREPPLDGRARGAPPPRARAPRRPPAAARRPLDRDHAARPRRAGRGRRAARARVRDRRGRGAAHALARLRAQPAVAPERQPRRDAALARRAEAGEVPDGDRGRGRRPGPGARPGRAGAALPGAARAALQRRQARRRAPRDAARAPRRCRRGRRGRGRREGLRPGRDLERGRRVRAVQRPRAARACGRAAGPRQPPRRRRDGDAAAARRSRDGHGVGAPRRRGNPGITPRGSRRRGAR